MWAEVAWGRYWGWDPKETCAFVTWVIYAAYLHARSTAGWRGRRAAWISVLGLRVDPVQPVRHQHGGVRPALLRRPELTLRRGSRSGHRWAASASERRCCDPVRSGRESGRVARSAAQRTDVSGDREGQPLLSSPRMLAVDLVEELRIVVRGERPRRAGRPDRPVEAAAATARRTAECARRFRARPARSPESSRRSPRACTSATSFTLLLRVRTSRRGASGPNPCDDIDREVAVDDDMATARAGGRTAAAAGHRNAPARNGNRGVAMLFTRHGSTS